MDECFLYRRRQYFHQMWYGLSRKIIYHNYNTNFKIHETLAYFSKHYEIIIPCTCIDVYTRIECQLPWCKCRCQNYYLNLNNFKFQSYLKSNLSLKLYLKHFFTNKLHVGHKLKQDFLSESHLQKGPENEIEGDLKV